MQHEVLWEETSMKLQRLSAAALAVLFTTTAMAQMAEVSGPGAEPECFKPLTADTKYFQWPAKPGPYRVALVNGFIANDWRVQMIKVAKAYAEQPEVAKDLAEFKVISVGEDIAAQIAAANNFIDQGFDAIIVNANNSAAFGGVVRKANEAGVVLLSFDNVIDDPNNIQINAAPPVSSCSRKPPPIRQASCSCAVPPASRSISRAPKASPKPSLLPVARST
jgi:ribose transport system substrate-binding protein